MTPEYSLEITKKIEAVFHRAELHRPLRRDCYDKGDLLSYQVREVAGSNQGTVHLRIEKFAGGGFAGQVYQVRIIDIVTDAGTIGALKKGGIYAMKILIPPSAFSLFFRNTIYWLGFQGPFQLQVNPHAARAGALWQKFIRRAAKVRFGNEKVVADIHATFIDHQMGSCGELSEWVEGRTWKLETDEHLEALNRWKKGKPVDPSILGSPEYRAKHEFMADFVNMLHDMGGQEFARQYEWSTCKSQPNCLKRLGTEDRPGQGLTAIDFRAGLALLWFLPMSPGDFKLILNGLLRGSLVQFDRGDLRKLSKFVETHRETFSDMLSLLTELKQAEDIYRNSVPDITHNHFRLLYSRKLWSTIFSSAVTGWRIKNQVDERAETKFRDSKFRCFIFFILGIIPFLGKFIKRCWARADWRAHYMEMLTSWAYFKRALTGRIAEKIKAWYRAGRVSEDRALKLLKSPARVFGHLPFSVLPAGLHRILTDGAVARERLAYLLLRPIKLYFNAHMREQWLQEMLDDGEKKHLLSHEDAQTIQSQIKDPFIQKYLKSLAVHVCTLPVTQVVSVIVAGIFWFMNPEMSPTSRGMAVAGILVAFQLTPISPGSLVRGLYVLYLVIRERNFKDYNIAVFLGFFKYIGYLAFPIQMTHRYPALARFMAGYWATEAVHVVPVFGESGALLEHGVYCLFYNRPLTIRRRMQARADMRAKTKPRYWPMFLFALMGAGLLGLTDFFWLQQMQTLPDLTQIWPCVVGVPLVAGLLATLSAGGAAIGKRIVSAVVCGIMMGLAYHGVTAFLGPGNMIQAEDLFIRGAWSIFVFSILSAIGAILTELMLPEPDKNIRNDSGR